MATDSKGLAAARKNPADSMPGGRYPIRNASDLKHAERAVGRTPPAGRPAVKAHIAARAKALGAKPSGGFNTDKFNGR